jgi:hypothetical protein
VTALVTARRIAVLVLPLPARNDPEMARLLAEARVKLAHKPSLFRLDKKSETPAPAPSSESQDHAGHVDKSPQKNQQETEAAEANIALETLRPVATILLADTLAERLHSDLKLTVVPEATVQTALAALDLSPTEAATPEGAQRLCTRLDCQALVVVRLSGFLVQEGATRDVTLWADVRIPGGVFRRETVGTKSAPETEPAALPGEFSVGSTASSGHRLFSSRYAITKLVLAREAAQQAAALATHTLRTGEIAPFMSPQTRILMTPTLGPAQMDRLLFTPQGRRALSDAAPDFGTALLFVPDLRPVPSQNILGPDAARQVLGDERARLSALWREEGSPDPARVQALGRHLSVDYVLLAHVPSIEVSEGPLETPEAPLSAARSTLPHGIQSRPSAPTPTQTQARVSAVPVERQARAEVVGALVRVRDGAPLWQGHAAATMSARSLRNGRPIRLMTDAEVARDAVRFALIQLRRDFARYRAEFEQ